MTDLPDLQPDDAHERIRLSPRQPPAAPPAEAPPNRAPPTEHTLGPRLLEERPWRALRVFADLVALVIGCLAGLLAEPGSDGVWLLVFPPLALFFLRARGRYVRSLHDVVLTSAAPGFGAISISAMTVFGLHLFVSGERDSFSSTIVATWFASLATITIVGFAFAFAEQAFRRRGIVASATLIVGADATGFDIALRLRRHPEYGLHAVGFLDITTDLRLTPGVPPLLGTLDELGDVAERYGIRNVIIGFPHASHRAMLALVTQCDALGIATNVVPRLSAAVNNQTRFEYLGTVPLLNLRATDPGSWRFALKYAVDRAVAALLLVVLSPLIVLIAVAVRLSSPGPIFFRQLRAGRDGRAFNLLKFRTMTGGENDADWDLGPGLAPGGVEGVDRRTSVGRFLRRTSLDELPQLFNVLRGEMSIIGPRPERPEFAELFREEVERYADRHRVRAGITGWAQVHGCRGQTPLADRVELDNFYIEHWSLGLDLKILLLTIPALLRGS